MALKQANAQVFQIMDHILDQKGDFTSEVEKTCVIDTNMLSEWWACDDDDLKHEAGLVRINALFLGINWNTNTDLARELGFLSEIAENQFTGGEDHE